jgi:hypothetical protein
MTIYGGSSTKYYRCGDAKKREPVHKNMLSLPALPSLAPPWQRRRNAEGPPLRRVSGPSCESPEPGASALVLQPELRGGDSPDVLRGGDRVGDSAGRVAFIQPARPCDSCASFRYPPAARSADTRAPEP